ncbi:hypothetical protein L3i22_060260 [Actinoplanes sp. L3-i22]|nr:hypothetical protein L3i22_060260 [Actinoplanes sp. L3-i22]
MAFLSSPASSRPEELDLPGTFWTVVLQDGAPAAWCAAHVQNDGVLKYHSNYKVCHGRSLATSAAQRAVGPDAALAGAGRPVGGAAQRGPHRARQADLAARCTPAPDRARRH